MLQRCLHGSFPRTGYLSLFIGEVRMIYSAVQTVWIKFGNNSECEWHIKEYPEYCIEMSNIKG